MALKLIATGTVSRQPTLDMLLIWSMLIRPRSKILSIVGGRPCEQTMLTKSSWKIKNSEKLPASTVVWLGLNDKSKEGTFVGTDGCPPKFTFWDVNEPNDLGGEDCVSIRNTDVNHDNGAWNDFSCTDQYAFICEINF
ncbi:putative macrophage mannose receptor 1 [Apostichopus japonicus]|uniref:Putative macrophage mannose receptor 1 n=1 Tax=Stichopus japonicus TaxID=307972 RepID=A0A2G8JRQ1_STIJA|nr:putative macrophage mannose receptor 1 [Apostichopus japonicus]